MVPVEGSEVDEMFGFKSDILVSYFENLDLELYKRIIAVINLPLYPLQPLW